MKNVSNAAFSLVWVAFWDPFNLKMFITSLFGYINAHEHFQICYQKDRTQYFGFDFVFLFICLFVCFCFCLFVCLFLIWFKKKYQCRVNQRNKLVRQGQISWLSVTRQWFNKTIKTDWFCFTSSNPSLTKVEQYQVMTNSKTSTELKSMCCIVADRQGHFDHPCLWYFHINNCTFIMIHD